MYGEVGEARRVRAGNMDQQIYIYSRFTYVEGNHNIYYSSVSTRLTDDDNDDDVGKEDDDDDHNHHHAAVVAAAAAEGEEEEEEEKKNSLRTIYFIMAEKGHIITCKPGSRLYVCVYRDSTP